jgi:glutathione S-transferase
MSVPILFHDPTSEPSRAVHWFALEAGIEMQLSYVWLTRGEHRSPRLVEVNPGHQVPALKHDELCLTEASAIMVYLAEIADLVDLWIGADPVARALTNRFLSWHHTNTRLKLTLDYLLPVLLMPAYKAIEPPAAEEVHTLRARGRESLALLEVFLLDRGSYLGGERPSIADLFIASDLFALDIDPDRDKLLKDLPTVEAWLERLRERDGYQLSHAPWNAVVPKVRQLIRSNDKEPRDPSWVADVCARYAQAGRPAGTTVQSSVSTLKTSTRSSSRKVSDWTKR